ncbi:stalk domain-containing protein [Paenibacillus paeoniae]|nr:stalk domain-containing protein [Paenibacillus paeoniae]
MKKLWIVLVAVLLCTPLLQHANASEKVITVYIDGVKVNFSSDPILKNGTTFVQFRPIFETLGYEIAWDPAKKRITAHNDETEMILTVGSTSVAINGVVKEIKDPPYITKGNTLVPVRFISEYSGKLVKWDSIKREIKITSNDDQNNIACKTLTNCIDLGNEKSVKEMLKPNTIVTHKQFELSVKNDRTVIAKLLITHGYDLRKLSVEEQKTLLKIALDNRFFDTMSMLIENGIYVDLELNYLTSSALVMAIKNKDKEMVRLLLSHGADPAKKYSNGTGKEINNFYFTPMNLAYEMKEMDIYDLLAHKAKTMAEVPVPNGVSVRDIKELRNYLDAYHTRLSTNLGIVRLGYSIDENTSRLYLYDIKVNFSGEVLVDNKLETGMNHIAIENIFDNIKFTETQKVEFFRQLREFTEDTAKITMAWMPGKKITGGFYKFTSYVPQGIPIELRQLALEVYGSSINQFLTWSNYTPDQAYYYHETEISDFHWYGFLDDQNVTTDVPLKKISIPAGNYKIAVGESLAIPYQLLPEKATDVELVWESFYPHIASVDSNGVVVGLKAGLASIKVYSKHDPGIFANFLVWVGDPLKM